MEFGGFSVFLWFDERCKSWEAKLVDFPPTEGFISAGGDTPEQALAELKTVWSLVADSYRDEGKQPPTPGIQKAAA